MIIFGDSSQEPFIYLKDCYQKSFKTEKAIEAISLSTIDIEKRKPYSRFVNIKYIDNNKLIFFSNYQSNNAIQINKVNNVSCIFYLLTRGIYRAFFHLFFCDLHCSSASAAQ